MLAEHRSLSLWQRGLDRLADLGVGVKVNLLLLGLGLLPPLGALLFLHETGGGGKFLDILALYIAAVVLLHYPLCRLVEEFIVLRQTRRINTYVEQVKAGRPVRNFQLPPEKGEEHDFLRLQRNIFWMVQGLKSRELRLQETLRKLETAQRQVLESIEYAGLIQRSLLPAERDLQLALGEHFLLWLPRDGVGGDAYWVKRSGNLTWLAVFDCTGHGVPGAFLTLIVASLFEQNCDQCCNHNPALLLARMHRGLQAALSRHGKTAFIDDGLEGSVCCLDRDTGVLHFAGARSSLLLVDAQGCKELRGDRSGVGFVHVPPEQEFANHTLPLLPEQRLYLFTDGITDQIGGPKRLPAGRSRLRHWLVEHATLPMAEQRRLLEQNYSEYKGRETQRDDVTVLGFCAREFTC